MNESRIAQLRKFLEEDPNDAFSLYALALEYLQDQPEASSTLFSKLLSVNPEYLPTYYQAAQLQVELQQKEEAEIIFKAGIELALKKNDRHALAELQSAYQNFLMEDY